MSPGAFWGHPGGVLANPMINPAVGAPVHVLHMNMTPSGGGDHHYRHGGQMSPGAVLYGVAAGPAMHEPGGYFEGYFPPANGAGSMGFGAGGVESEILRDPTSLGGIAPGGKGDRGQVEKGREEVAVRVNGNDVHEYDVVDGDEDGEWEESSEHPANGHTMPRRHSSTTTPGLPPWHSLSLSSNAGAAADGDLRVWEGQQRECDSREVVIDDVYAETNLNSNLNDAAAGSNMPISRTQSLSSASKKQSIRDAVYHRSVTDPITGESDGEEAGLMVDGDADAMRNGLGHGL